MTTLYLCACAVIAYAGFCRLVRTDLMTRLAVRSSFWALTVSAAAGITAVLMWGHAPGWPETGMAGAIAAVQVVTSRLWRGGVPQHYIRQPRRRGCRMRR